MSKFALIGERLGHSYSKLIHDRYFELTGRHGFSYNLIEISKDRLKEEFYRISREYDGINVTIPYKLDVMEFMTDISSEVLKIGAVNTVKFTREGSFGYNTDYYGFRNTLAVNGINPSGKRVIILGTGGASKAALSVCRDMGAGSISFVSSSGKSVGDYGALTYSDLIEGDILINCTPVGMYPGTGVSPIENLYKNFEAVVDMIYNPSETELMKRASANGSKTANGLYMLVSQAIHSEEIWNDEQADKEITDIIYNELKTHLEGGTK